MFSLGRKSQEQQSCTKLSLALELVQVLQQICDNPDFSKSKVEALTRAEQLWALLGMYPNPNSRTIIPGYELAVAKELVKTCQTLRENGLGESVGNSKALALTTVPEGQPPFNAEFLLHLFLSSSDCDALVGDLQERFAYLEKRLGQKRADWWFRKQVFTSLWPLFRAAARSKATKIVIHLLGIPLRTFGMGTIADELKKLARPQRSTRKK